VLPPGRGYEEAWRILSEQYGKPHAIHVITRKYIDTLTNGPPIAVSDDVGLGSLAQKMKGCELVLQKLNYSVNHDSDDW
jgi:hypothetical protein